MKSLAGASNDLEANGGAARLDNGISSGHAYSVLDVYELVPQPNGTFDKYRKSLDEKSNKKDVKLVK